MIALLCPTRDRHEQFIRMADSACKTSYDHKGNIYAGSNGKREDNYTEMQFPEDCPTVYMWQKLCDQALKLPENKLFMLASDDIIFATPGWDKALLDHYEALENKIHVYALQDSRDVNGTPHPIVSREYIEAMGYFLPPIFMHWYVDSWTVDIAKENNCFTHMKDYLLVHDKPSDQGNADETHNHIRRMGWRERDKFVNDSCQKFLEFEKQRLLEWMVC